MIEQQARSAAEPFSKLLQLGHSKAKLMFSISVGAEPTAQKASQLAVQVRITFALRPVFLRRR